MVMNEGIIACEEGQIIKIFRNVDRIRSNEGTPLFFVKGLLV